MKRLSPPSRQSSGQTSRILADEGKNTYPKKISRLILITSGIMLLGTVYQPGQTSDDALFIDKSGRVGIGTAEPGANLEVAGSTKLNHSVGINSSPAEDQLLSIRANQGQMPFNVTDATGNQNWLTVNANGQVIMNGQNVGIGILDPKAKLEVSGNTKLNGNVTVNGGNVGIGTAVPEARLDVEGDARIKGTVTRYARHQVDDKPEGFYEISPRYHLTLTGVNYSGRTRTIPHETLKALCADSDGCQVRLAMTRWDSDVHTESASVFFTFYYSADDGRWRASATDAKNAWGIDGDKKTKHVRVIWNTCHFTDGTYKNYKNQGDNEKGMQLLVWNKYKNKNRTCELTLID